MHSYGYSTAGFQVSFQRAQNDCQLWKNESSVTMLYDFLIDCLIQHFIPENPVPCDAFIQECSSCSDSVIHYEQPILCLSTWTACGQHVARVIVVL